MSDIKVSKKVPVKDKKHAVLTIEGELTLQNAGELKKKIQKNIAGLNSVKLKAVNIDQADIAFIQIIEALKKQFNENEKKLEIEVDYPYDVKTLFINAGFEA